jgi:hypothetical protein
VGLTENPTLGLLLRRRGSGRARSSSALYGRTDSICEKGSMRKKEKAMWKPKNVGTIIASRKFKIRKGKVSKSAFLDVGCPVRDPKGTKNDPWICPILIRGIGRDEFSYAAGFDGIQALTLALNLSMTLLPTFAQWQGYQIEFLDPKMPLIYDSWDLEDLQEAQKKHAKKFEKLNAKIDRLFEKNRLNEKGRRKEIKKCEF